VTLRSVDPASQGAATRQARGTVEEIYIAPEATAAVVSMTEVEAVEGVGLAGDRYAAKIGTFSNDPRFPNTGRHVTLIDAAMLEDFTARTGVALPPGVHRRNMVTRGVDLDALLGQHFKIGEVECIGIRPQPPCSHLERITRLGMLRDMARNGCLRAEFLTSGVIRVGDAIVAS
jgi:MOSC domain-containing protein YiiM